jgi:hypothetical protein
MAMTTTDRPRRIVVCHPDDFVWVNKAVMALGLGDVLVMPNRFVKVGTTYVMDGDLSSVIQ